MSSRVNSANLAEAVKELSIEWQQTKNYWNDIKSHEFEAHYLEKLPGMAAEARKIIEDVDALLRKVRSDCE
jgi:hypothetical protein